MLWFILDYIWKDKGTIHAQDQLQYCMLQLSHHILSVSHCMFQGSNHTLTKVRSDGVNHHCRLWIWKHFDAQIFQGAWSSIYSSPWSSWRLSSITDSCSVKNASIIWEKSLDASWLQSESSHENWSIELQYLNVMNSECPRGSNLWK